MSAKPLGAALALTGVVRSREHLLHLLAEAAELEHNLLCSYLYAAFSLKTELRENLLPHELIAVRRWHAAIMGVCMEEMTHLAQVANLMGAVGSRPHFDRPNLPVSPGYHPAGIQVALAPLDLETLDHFIYLERPEASDVQDAASFRPTVAFERRAEIGVLMPSAPDYETIGEFYDILSAGLDGLAEAMGAEALFVGPAEHQLHAEEIGSKDLLVVSDMASARRAIHFIVVQGEGSPSEAAESHFDAFSKIREELLQLTEERPLFAPSRPVARNPVMRRPLVEGRVHVRASPAAALLDTANAVYALMLRCLAAVYDISRSEAALRKALLGCATGLMKLLGAVSNELTQLPASAAGSPNAGVTFAMLRSTEGLAPGVSIAIVIRQRLALIEAQVPRLPISKALGEHWSARLATLGATLAEAVPAAAP